MEKELNFCDITIFTDPSTTECLQIKNNKFVRGKYFWIEEDGIPKDKEISFRIQLLPNSSNIFSIGLTTDRIPIKVGK